MAAAIEYEDAEWLHALLAASHEIGRYATARATHADTPSVRSARDVTSALLEGMLAFDLRNGNLRRSYDALKYVVRRLEDTLYDLSLTEEPVSPVGDAEEVTSWIDDVALTASRQRYEASDSAREVVIKRCRDLQKLAKGAIFSLHRGQLARAELQLAQATEGCNALLTSCEAEHIDLRQQGSVKGVIEELLEAKLYAAWLAAPGTILRDDASVLGVQCTVDEYLGALGDFSGELGRHAVARATARDAPAVHTVLGTMLTLQTAVLRIGDLWPRAAGKKADAMRNATRNLERLLYDHSLAERTGRRPTSVATAGPDTIMTGGAVSAGDDEDDER